MTLGYARVALRGVLVTLVVATACAKQPPPPTFGGLPDLAREQWLVVAARALRKESCESGSHFRRCTMGVSRDACDHVVSLGARRCSESWGPTIEARISAGDHDRRRRDELRGCVWHHADMELGPTRLDMLCVLTPR